MLARVVERLVNFTSVVCCCCHGCRLEAELEEKRLQEREEMMAELQAMKEAAQVEMDRQRTDYEHRISQLSKDMVSSLWP